MLTAFYGIIFVISLIFTASFVFIWHKHFDVNLTMIFTLVPVSCIGYLMSSIATTLDSALSAQMVQYIGGCFLQLFILLSIFNLCKYNLPRWVRTGLFGVCAVIYASVLSIGGSSKLFYTSAKLDVTGKRPLLIREYGPMHTVYTVVLVLFFLVGIITLIYTWFNKKDAPRRILMLLVVPDVICMLCYVIMKTSGTGIDIVPAGYVIAQITYLFIARRVTLYDVGDTVIDTMVHDGAIGYITVDYKYRYLGSNEVARMLIPEIGDVAIDDMVGYKPGERKVRHYIENFRKDNADSKSLFTYNGSGGEDNVRYYDVEVSYLFDGTQRRGYIVTFTDDTENKKYIKLIDRYNDDLKAEVDAKTKHIVKMHDNLIVSLAMMVESRDNSTGGHIKRTSDGVRILVEEIIKEGKLKLTPEFCKAVIKAAPMHDLGKIAVDDAVLRKPGKFLPEEFEKMKKHAAEGARVIHEILRDTDDENFKVIAENVAHYHHERYDGSGYPEGKKGEEIPLEARIMAIADVYDALVSKRVYKDAFSLEKADSIIREGMGTQFDPKLQTAYENARPRLEDYYLHAQVQS